MSNWWLKGGHCKPKGSHQWSNYKSIVEDRLISDISLFSSLFIFLLLAILILNKMERQHSEVIWKLKTTINRNWQLIRLFNLNLIIFGLLVIFVILCRASLGIPWDPHFAHRYHAMKQYLGQKCSSIANRCF